jgi:hypothetical protein
MIKMVDHNCMRHWIFRYKWWLNNKSRMYVLENTGKNQGGLVNLMSMGWSLPSIFAIYLLILSCDL